MLSRGSHTLLTHELSNTLLLANFQLTQNYDLQAQDSRPQAYTYMAPMHTVLKCPETDQLIYRYLVALGAGLYQYLLSASHMTLLSLFGNTNSAVGSLLQRG